jgi:hemin uptake protein HemP
LQLRVILIIIPPVGHRGRSEGRVNDKSPELDQAERVARPAPRIRSTDLLRGGRELVIEHGADEYRLRLTSKLKLILTK